MPGSPSLVGRAPGISMKTIKRVLARDREFKSLSRRLSCYIHIRVRLPEFYDGIYNYLKEIGIEEL